MGDTKLRHLIHPDYKIVPVINRNRIYSKGKRGEGDLQGDWGKRRKRGRTNSIG